MAKNLSRKFATMSDDERRRFALEEEEGTDDRPAELAFDEPRNEERMATDSEDRDGMSALLDEEAHENAVNKAAREHNDQSSQSE